MTIPFVDLYAQYLGMRTEIDSAFAAVIRESGYIRSRFVEEFEEQWARMSERQHCVSCANGTDALYIAMRSLGIKGGDEVITTAHSWISTSETITQSGGRVVFCDTERNSFTIDPAQIEAKITPRTVGIIPVHLYGQPANMSAIMPLAQKHALWVIEDCAQAHSAQHHGQQVGTFGVAATYSFYPGKNLGAYGDAGSVVTNDERLANWCNAFARHGGKGDHVMEGINSRLDGLQAAILSAKMPHLSKWTERRRTIAALYADMLGAVGDLVLPSLAEGNTHVYHLFVIRTALRDALRNHLAHANISTGINYPRALPFYPAYGYLRHVAEDFPVAYSEQSRILSLPIYPEMTDEMVDYVAASIRQFYSH